MIGDFGSKVKSVGYGFACLIRDCGLSTRRALIQCLKTFALAVNEFDNSILRASGSGRNRHERQDSTDIISWHGSLLHDDQK